MVFLFILGIIYEGIKTGRDILKKKAARPILRGETYDLNGGKCQKVPNLDPVVNSTRYAQNSDLLASGN